MKHNKTPGIDGITAEFIKVLDQIVSKTQSGFVPGRNISDCTRLIYDLLYLAQDKDYTGLLI